MSHRAPALFILFLLFGLAAWAIAAPSPASTPGLTPRQNITFINGLPDTAGVFLPDSAMLARVDARKITAREFVETWFNAYAPDRPEQDSAGRAEWLNSMVNKEVLARVAKAANRPFTFEDRQAMRERTERVLSNMLFIRAVLDSIRITDADLQALYKQLDVEYHLQLIVVPGAVLADSVYRELVAKRLKWNDAHARFSAPQEGTGENGDLGWVSRFGMTWSAADKVVGIKAGGFSAPLRRGPTFDIYHCLETRTVERPSLESMRSWLVSQVQTRKQSDLSYRLQESIRQAIGLKYDSLNIAWAAPHFRPAFSTTSTKGGMPNFHINAMLPNFGPADTSRVLARYRDGQLTLSRLMAEYAGTPVTKRSDISTPDGFRNEVDAIVLEPYRARIAVERGLDKDPIAVEAIEKERERILVEHMYSDSIESKIFISKEQRQKYYKQHLASFYTYAAARYAQLVYTDTLAAQAMAKRLRAGERGDSILRADSIAGRPRLGYVRIETEAEHTVFHQVLFEDLKPGQVAVIPPDINGRCAVIQLLEFDTGHQLSFEQSDGYCTEALTSIAAEERLNKLIARHKKNYKIESRPELVMRIRLVDSSRQRD